MGRQGAAPTAPVSRMERLRKARRLRGFEMGMFTLRQFSWGRLFKMHAQHAHENVGMGHHPHAIGRDHIVAAFRALGKDIGGCSPDGA